MLRHLRKCVEVVATWRLVRFTLERNRYLRELPVRSLLPLYGAVFLTFATLSFLIDLWEFGGRPVGELFLIAGYAGGLAAFMVWAVMRGGKFLPVGVVAVILVSSTFFRYFPSREVPAAQKPDLQSIRVRVAADAGAIFALVYAGYVLFITFIGLEGVKNLRLKTEIDLARSVHARLVPTVEAVSGDIRIYGRSLPSSEVGGDLIDVIEAGGRLFCYIADVSGHGVAAGVLMGMVKSVARTTLLHSTTVEQMMRDLNAVLPHVKDGSMFATFACLCFDGSGEVQYSLAGHLPILHYSHGSHAVSRLVLSQFPLGLFATAEYCAGRAPCDTGDLFLLVTDGITDTTDRNDREFGLEPLEQLIAQYATAPLADLFDRIPEAVTRHGKQADDRSLLLVRC